MISDETSFSQFQYLVRVKFDGDVEELLQLLKSGGGEAVSVAQLAEYLMSQDIDFHSKNEAIAFSEKLANSDGIVTLKSVNSAIDAFLINHKDSDLDDEDFNFTADSLMREGSPQESGDDDGDSENGQGSHGDENDGQYFSNSSTTPPVLEPFAEHAQDDQDDQEDENNLNDVSMLSDDNDSRPTSPSRAFHQPSPRLMSSKKYWPKPARPEEGDDVDGGDDEGLEDEDEDESDNSSIDTAGMKHSQTVDSENFFFCPDPEPEPDIEITAGGDQQHNQQNDEKLSSEDCPLSSESVFQPDASPSPPGSRVVDEKNDVLSDMDQDDVCDDDKNVEGMSEVPVPVGSRVGVKDNDTADVDVNVGLSLTALPRPLMAVPHPFEPLENNIVEVGQNNLINEKELGVDQRNHPDNELETNSATSDITDQGSAVSNQLDSDSYRNRQVESKGVILNDDVIIDDISEIKTTVISSSSSDTDNLSEMTQRDVTGLWEMHPVRQSMITEKKQKVFAFGRTSYEDKRVRNREPTHATFNLSNSPPSTNLQPRNEPVKSPSIQADCKARIGRGYRGGEAKKSRQSGRKSNMSDENKSAGTIEIEERINAFAVAGLDSDKQGSHKELYQKRCESKSGGSSDRMSLNRSESKGSDNDTQQAQGGRDESELYEESTFDILPGERSQLEDAKEGYDPEISSLNQKLSVRQSYSGTAGHNFSRKGRSLASSTGIFKGQFYLDDHVHLLEKKVEVLSSVNVSTSQKIQMIEKVLDDKARLIDDVVLNEIDYLHRKVEQLQAFKSKSLKDINTLQDLQRGLNTHLDVKFRDFEVKENVRIAEYVKSSLNKELQSTANVQRKPQSSESKRHMEFKKRIKNVKSSGYGCIGNARYHNNNAQIGKGRNNFNKGVVTERNVSQETPSCSSIDNEHVSIADEEQQSPSDYDTSDRDRNKIKKENIQPEKSNNTLAQPQCEHRSAYEETPRPKIEIINDKVKPLVVRSPTVVKDKSASYLVKNPRERIVDFRFEESLRGSGLKESDTKDMDFANKVQRRKSLQEQRRKALMISKRVITSADNYSDISLQSFAHVGDDTSLSSSVSKSSSWWSDLMARKEEAEKKGFTSVMCKHA